MRRSDPRHVFAAMTAALEDMHSIAVEGQSPLLTDDMVQPLAAHIRHGVSRIEHLLSELSGPQHCSDGTV